jgi:hypothetical protein
VQRTATTKMTIQHLQDQMGPSESYRRQSADCNPTEDREQAVRPRAPRRGRA